MQITQANQLVFKSASFASYICNSIVHMLVPYNFIDVRCNFLQTANSIILLPIACAMYVLIE